MRLGAEAWARRGSGIAGSGGGGDTACGAAAAAGRVERLGSGAAGNSRRTVAAPPAGPNSARRWLTASSTSDPSTTPPRLTGRGGLLSTAISASACSGGAPGRHHADQLEARIHGRLGRAGRLWRRACCPAGATDRPRQPTCWRSPSRRAQVPRRHAPAGASAKTPRWPPPRPRLQTTTGASPSHDYHAAHLTRPHAADEFIPQRPRAARAACTASR